MRRLNTLELVIFQDGCFNVDGFVPVCVVCDVAEVIGNVYENPELVPQK